MSLFVLFLCSCTVFAQVGLPGGANEVIVKHADITTMQKTKDSASLVILEGNVVMQQGKSLFYCNKCIRNTTNKTFEAWGKVHINDSDTTDIYADHLRYLEEKQIAYFDGNVKLTDGKAVLTTPSLEYSMNTNIANYKNGGKVVNNKTIITSREAFYYSDIKDAYFKKDVLVNDPAYNIKADSLLYNTERQVSSFISNTTIKDSADRVITTKKGFYNLKTGEAEFTQRSTIRDTKGKSSVVADSINLTDDVAKAKGKAVVSDSIRGTVIIADLVYQDRKSEAMLATQKPLMIIKQEGDSIYITADTLFSAKLTELYRLQEKAEGKNTKQAADSNNLNKEPLPNKNVPTGKKSVTDSITNNIQKPIIKDSTAFLRDSLVKSDAEKLGLDSLHQKTKDDNIKKTTPPAITNKAKEPPATAAVKQDTAKPVAGQEPKDTIAAFAPKKPLAENDSTNRYFEAFHNVRIFTDSMQAVSDSLFYSFQDSVFRLYNNPVVWSKENQITGDTIYLHTKNKQPSWFEAAGRAFMVNMLEKEAFNQIKSSRMDGRFTDGNLDSLRAKGNAESIYFMQDADSAYTGINKSRSDIIDVYMKNKEVQKVVFRSDAKGTLYPIKQKRPSEMRLEGFQWLESRRPKTKYALFE